MSDFSWTQTCNMNDSPRGIRTETTLDAAVRHYATLSPNEKVRASVMVHDPIDLGDGQGEVTEIEGDALDRLSDLFEKHQASLAR